MNGTVLERFWNKVEITNSCWNWIGATLYGYGYFNNKGKTTLAHRFIYKTLIGEMPINLQIDHLCRNRKCVNPDHLELVTARVNTLRSEAITAKNARKTHCKRGHEFTLENTYNHPDGSRQCRICRRLAKKKYNSQN